MPFKNPHPLYGIWAAMRQRCTNPRYKQWKDYGGRGITICEEWSNFHQFVADIGDKPSPKHSLERIDNDKGYSPDNCKWATKKEQQRNRRDAVFVEIEGKSYRAIEIIDKIGIKHDTLIKRAARGMSYDEIMSGKRLPLPHPKLGPDGKLKTHCPHGHEFTPDNTYFTKEGWRNCRACHRAKVARQSAKKKQLANKG